MINKNASLFLGKASIKHDVDNPIIKIFNNTYIDNAI
jgi:hypothetical protein